MLAYIVTQAKHEISIRRALARHAASALDRGRYARSLPSGRKPEKRAQGHAGRPSAAVVPPELPRTVPAVLIPCMDKFIERHADRISGTLGCFDRVLFRGYLPLMSGAAMAAFLRN